MFPKTENIVIYGIIYCVWFLLLGSAAAGRKLRSKIKIFPHHYLHPLGPSVSFYLPVPFPFFHRKQEFFQQLCAIFWPLQLITH